MKIGDIVEVVGGCDMCFNNGDIATLIRVDCDGDWWADFNGHGNSEVWDDGIWCVGRSEGIDFHLVELK